MMDIATLPDLLSYDELAAQGLTRYGLDRLIESGEFERIAPGLFLRSGLTDDTTAAWTAIAAKQTDATLCLLTALTARADRRNSHSERHRYTPRHKSVTVHTHSSLGTASTPTRSASGAPRIRYRMDHPSASPPPSEPSSICSACVTRGAATSHSVHSSSGCAGAATAPVRCSRWPRASRRRAPRSSTPWRSSCDPTGAGDVFESTE